MTYRVIQWGTGAVGGHALETIIEHPNLELAGVRVYNPEKVGKDAGELFGGQLTGVVTTDDTDQILEIDADCVCYNPLGTTLGSQSQPLDDICRLLASGKNVVSSAVEYYGYLHPEVGPRRAGAEAAERINAACQAGATSFYHAGINPGFAMDLWPITLSRVCARIDRLTAVEVVDMQHAESSQIIRDAIGFGMPEDYVSPLDQQLRNVKKSAFYMSVVMVADAIGVEIDDAVYYREVALAEQAIATGTGPIEAGTVAAMKMHIDGLRAGEVLISLEYVWRVSDDIAPEWPRGDSRWLVSIEGDPRVESELVLSTDRGVGRATSMAVATLCVNAVPVVCEAAPGPLNNLTIPPHGGGYFPLSERTVS